MLFEIVATVIVGLGTAGVILLPMKLIFRKKPPKVIVIGAAGLAMLAFSVMNRQNWSNNVANVMPPHIEIVHEVPHDQAGTTWGLFYPKVSRIVAVDHCGVATHPDLPDMRMFEVLIMQPHDDTIAMRHIIDCAGQRLALTGGATEADENGLPLGLDWVEGGEPPYLFEALCVPKAEPVVCKGAPAPFKPL